MVGVGTSEVNLDQFRHSFCSLLGTDGDSWGLSYTGEELDKRVSYSLEQHLLTLNVCLRFTSRDLLRCAFQGIHFVILNAIAYSLAKVEFKFVYINLCSSCKIICIF